MSVNSIFTGVGSSFNPYTYVGAEVERGDISLIRRQDAAKIVVKSEVAVNKIDVVQEREDHDRTLLAEQIGVEFVEAV